MNEIVKKEAQSTELTNVGGNFFEQYGNSVSNRNIVGDLLKFSKGDYLRGQDDEDVPVGTKMVVDMTSLSIGWIKWADNKPEQQIMGPVVEGYKPQKRSELGDTDQDQWEVDQQGKPRDPWQFSNYVLMKEPGKAHAEENLLTFATSSRGGLNAIGELCKAYGKAMRERPDEHPIITLGVDSYNHPNKEFGRIKVPVFEIVGWEPKELPTEKKPPKTMAKKAAKK